MARIPADAFETYLALGDERSYRALAEQYGVSKRSVTKKAARENWQQRLADIERAARDRIDARLIESIDSMNSRHLKMVQALQGKALEGLRSTGPLNAAAAARALDAAIARERLIRSTPDAVRGKPELEPGPVVIQVITGVPPREPIDVPCTASKALPAPPSDGHEGRRPGVN